MGRMRMHTAGITAIAACDSARASRIAGSAANLPQEAPAAFSDAVLELAG